MLTDIDTELFESYRTHIRALSDHILNKVFYEDSFDFNVIAMNLGQVYIQNVNYAFYENLGWSLKDLETIPWLDLIHPNDRLLAAWAASGNRFFSQDKNNFLYLRYRHKNGTYHWIKFYRKSFIYNESRIALARDVTLDPTEKHITNTLQRLRDGYQIS